MKTLQKTRIVSGFVALLGIPYFSFALTYQDLCPATNAFEIALHQKGESICPLTLKEGMTKKSINTVSQVGGKDITQPVTVYYSMKDSPCSPHTLKTSQMVAIMQNLTLEKANQPVPEIIESQLNSPTLNGPNTPVISGSWKTYSSEYLCRYRDGEGFSMMVRAYLVKTDTDPCNASYVGKTLAPFCTVSK